MDSLQNKRNAPKQVYVPVHRRMEVKTKEAYASLQLPENLQPSSKSEVNHKESTPIKRKGRGQFKASAFDSYIACNPRDNSCNVESETKQNKEAIVSKSQDTKETEKIDQQDSIDDVISKISVLKINEELSIHEGHKKRDIEQKKPSSRDRNTPGRDPNRPATSNMVAKRLIHGALGIKLVRSSEERKEDKEMLQKAKEEREQKKDSLNRN